jgi:hypothetical protein
MSVPAPLDNNKETHGFLPAEDCGHASPGNLCTIIWRTGGHKLPDIVMSLFIDEQEV